MKEWKKFQGVGTELEEVENEERLFSHKSKCVGEKGMTIFGLFSLLCVLYFIVFVSFIFVEFVFYFWLVWFVV